MLKANRGFSRFGGGMQANPGAGGITGSGYSASPAVAQNNSPSPSLLNQTGSFMGTSMAKPGLGSSALPKPSSPVGLQRLGIPGNRQLSLE